MIAVLLHWEEAFVNSCNWSQKSMDLYRENCVAAGATHILCVQQSVDTPPSGGDVNIGFAVYPDLDTALAAYPTASLVYLDAGAGSVALKDFTHPAEDVIYVVGPDSAGLPQSGLPAGQKVAIEGGEYWSFTAAAIVLRDRLVKG